MCLAVGKPQKISHLIFMNRISARDSRTPPKRMAEKIRHSKIIYAITY
jgi:hypothetical protein